MRSSKVNLNKAQLVILLTSVNKPNNNILINYEIKNLQSSMAYRTVKAINKQQVEWYTPAGMLKPILHLINYMCSIKLSGLQIVLNTYEPDKDSAKQAVNLLTELMNKIGFDGIPTDTFNLYLKSI
jgi:small-conductance mechanosensitive channel